MVLDNCFDCYSIGALAADATAAAPAATAAKAPNLMPLAALLDLGRRAVLEELDCSLLLRQHGMDAFLRHNAPALCATAQAARIGKVVRRRAQPCCYPRSCYDDDDDDDDDCAPY